jgi:hypothetical protein
MRFHVFYTENIPSQVYQDHKQCCDKLELDVIYHKYPEFKEYDEVYSAHGNFMTSILEEEKEIACFLDIDCLPYNKSILEKAYNWAKENKSFVGNAQNISHTNMRNHVYAAASCLFVSKDAWNQLGSPSLSWFTQNGNQIDTAQILTLRADQIGMDYQLMYPIGWDEGEGYKLGGYGKYGTGTLYPATWHYFRISKFKDEIPNLWIKTVESIITNTPIVPYNNSIFYD